MRHRWVRRASALALVALLSMAGTLAYAQGTAMSTLVGTVTDTSGGVVPGADIVARHVATGTVFTAVSGANGGFNIPSVPTGRYTVTVTLSGFKTIVLNEVDVTSAGAATVKAVLELGQIEETVLVMGASEIIQTQTSAIASTITSTQITNLPIGRDAFGVVLQMPGVVTTSGTRSATVMGLPQAAVNITLDGMNIQDNYMKTNDGMFTRVSPRIDAVEEVTVGAAGQGADAAGQGGVQIRFVTRGGTNKYQGSLYYYFRRDWMNTNTWFNLNRNFQPKARVAQYQPGGRFGGPIWIPGLFDGRDKAFFFVNYEVNYTPGTSTLSRTIMSPTSQQGLFQYGSRTVDLMALAAQNGHIATIDPKVAHLLSTIRASTATTGTVFDIAGDPTIQTYTWQFPTKGLTNYPTLRFDYNLTASHRLTASGTRNHLISDPDTLNGYYRYFPGFPTHGKQDSFRYSGQISLRSILGKNLVNELRVGATGGATYFNPELNAGMFSGQTPDFGGYAIGLSAFRSISNAHSTYTNSSREAYTKVVENTLSWLKGRHSLSMGASMTQADVWLENQNHVPLTTFGIVQGDPADGMFNTTNFPGASSTQLGYARNLYAVLAGRVATITRNARIDTNGVDYVILGKSLQEGQLRHFGFHVQDSWRVRPNLTVNAGLRYDLQFPFHGLNNSYSTATVADVFGVSGPGADLKLGSVATGLGNLYKPGAADGRPTTYQMLEKGTHGYNTDWDNLAPSIGVAWTTGGDSGLLRTILGPQGDSVFRGGYNIAYQRGGMTDYTGIYGNNPGVVITTPTRNLTNGNLGPLPVLLRSSDLGPPDINLKREYPMAVPSASSNIYIFAPDVTVPFSQAMSMGWQRALTRNMSLEARYVHTSNHGAHRTFNYNEVNIVESGFLEEFKKAQANLMANIAAGRGNTFAYTGVPGTSPLPILLAWINGRGEALAGQTTSYTGTTWTNSTYLGYLYQTNANPQSFASSLRTNATYKANALNAGLPANFFVVNPEVNNAYVRTNGFDMRYNGLQLILNRRFSRGLQLQANYSFGKGWQQDFYSLRVPVVWNQHNYSNSASATGNVSHVFFTNWVYELPFGQGKRFGSGAGHVLNRLIGDWTFTGVWRWQSGREYDLGNVRLIGMTAKDVQQMLKMRIVDDPATPYRKLVFNWPDDVIDNTIKAYSYDAAGYTQGEPTGRYFAPANSPGCIETVSGYGDCGVRSLVVRGPQVFSVDMSLGKRIPFTRTVNFEFQVNVYNVFNNLNFNPVDGIGSSTRSGYEVTGAQNQSRTGQLSFRINF